MVTIADVAERAGVSKTTVSHALSGKRPVASATQKRIEQVIEELGFRPSVLARSLRMQRTQMVALIIPDITNPYYPILARGLQDALIERDYYMFLCNTDGDKDQTLALIADAVQRQVDGIVVSSLYPLSSEIQEFLEQNVVFVSIGHSIDHIQVDRSFTNDKAGACEATRYLLAKGHQCIAMISGPPDMEPSVERLAGYQEALREVALPFDTTLVIEGAFTRASGAQAMHTLMQLAERPTAIFCANDLMAIGVLDYAREHTLRVPDDIAVVGYDDIEAASLVTPALTTVVNPAYEMGKAAGQLLLERITKEYEGPRREVRSEKQFIPRASA